jgi:protein-L-isoaspartate(D-aspartate) O-methyltransferase
MKTVLSTWSHLLLGGALALSFGQDDYAGKRHELAETLKRYGINNPRVIEALTSVERHLFVPENLRDMAYENHPLPIGHGQTISQPYIVAHMTELLGLKKSDRVLEIGTGSGYQAAILAVMVDSVFSIEIKEQLASEVKKRLFELGYHNAVTKCADGYFGWQEKASFDAILITCAANHIPPPLIEQLKVGGKMVLPLGSTRYYQTLVRITKKQEDILVEYLGQVAFVPMTGRIQKG